MSSSAIGIDLGTTFSCVAVWQNDRVVVIENEQGNRTTPSVVAFTDSERLVGEAASNQAIRNTQNTVFDVKRLIGRYFSDDEVQKDLKTWPFHVVRSRDNRPNIQVKFNEETQKFSPEQISAMVLTKMKQVAESYLNRPIKDAVVTVPADFNDSQRQATKNAGAIAGLNVLKILNEPTAAGLAYGVEQKVGKAGSHKLLVFDWGGGTLDVSILEIKSGEFKVVAVAGDSHLGGVDFDLNLAKHLAQEFKRQTKSDVTGIPKAFGRLRAAAERAKRILSSTLETTVEIDSLFNGVDFTSKVTRVKFENVNRSLFDKAMDLVKCCLKDAHISKGELQEVVLVGGSSRIPKMQSMLRDFLDGKQPSKGINPDEAVACGAAVHAATLAGHWSTALQNVVLTDVTPLSLGVGMRGDIFSIIIPKNTPLPAKGEGSYSTVEDNQTEATFDVREGERRIASKNHLLGELLFDGILPAPKGVPELRCKFEIGHDGILNMEVKEELTGDVRCMVVRNSQLSKEEMDRMLAEAQQFEAEDKRMKRVAKARNRLEDSLQEFRDKLRTKARNQFCSSSQTLKMVNALSSVEAWLAGAHGKSMDVSDFDKQFSKLDAAFSPATDAFSESEPGSADEGGSSQTDSDD